MTQISQWPASRHARRFSASWQAPQRHRLQSRKPRSRVMTDPDFLNVAASAEDWAGFGADGR